jgi:hypothetical protein
MKRKRRSENEKGVKSLHPHHVPPPPPAAPKCYYLNPHVPEARSLTKWDFTQEERLFCSARACCISWPALDTKLAILRSRGGDYILWLILRIQTTISFDSTARRERKLIYMARFFIFGAYDFCITITPSFQVIRLGIRS